LLNLVWYFFAGAFLINAVPHLVKGITGQSHMTPFGRISSPVLNIVWSFANIVIGLFILGLATGNGGLVLPWQAGLEGTNLIIFLVGAFANAAFLANFWSNPKARLPWQ